MLRIIQPGLGRPVQFPVDPNAEFLPGTIGQLGLLGNDVVMGVSDGIAPLGILDDIKASAFTQAVIDEIVIIRATNATYDGYNWKTSQEEMGVLNNSDIVPFSFTADVAGLRLNPRNGLLIAPSGTTLNYKADGSSTNNAIRTRVRYSYYVKTIAGDDTTLGSGHVTLWFTRGVFETDQFDLQAEYELNATLFVNSNGLLTTNNTISGQPGVAIVTRPPSPHIGTLEFLWL